MSRTSKLFKDTILGMSPFIEGDIAEIGVLTGTTFKVLCGLAQSRGVMAHALDSFKGLDTPTERDLDKSGQTIYPRGRFDIGGVGNFHVYMSKYKVARKAYTTWEGFIPECLVKVPKSIKFAYIRLDVDQYEPTKTAAEWAMECLTIGGVLSSHDYFPSSNILASGAMKDIISSYADVIDVIGNDEDEIFIRRVE